MAALNEGTTQPTFIEYTITTQDLKGPYAQSIPVDYAEQSKMKGLYYTRVTEMLGEKFHMDELFLQKINSGASFNKVGAKDYCRKCEKCHCQTIQKPSSRTKVQSNCICSTNKTR